MVVVVLVVVEGGFGGQSGLSSVWRSPGKVVLLSLLALGPRPPACAPLHTHTHTLAVYCLLPPTWTGVLTCMMSQTPSPPRPPPQTSLPPSIPSHPVTCTAILLLLFLLSEFLSAGPRDLATTSAGALDAFMLPRYAMTGYQSVDPAPLPDRTSVPPPAPSAPVAAGDAAATAAATATATVTSTATATATASTTALRSSATSPPQGATAAGSGGGSGSGGGGSLPRSAGPSAPGSPLSPSGAGAFFATSTPPIALPLPAGGVDPSPVSSPRSVRDAVPLGGLGPLITPVVEVGAGAPALAFSGVQASATPTGTGPVWASAGPTSGRSPSRQRGPTRAGAGVGAGAGAGVGAGGGSVGLGGAGDGGATLMSNEAKKSSLEARLRKLMHRKQ